MNRDSKKWMPFVLHELFVTQTYNGKFQFPTGANVKKSDLKSGNVPRITVTSYNNGIYGFYSSDSKNYRVYKNIVTVSFLGDCFYHPYECSLDMKVHCLMLKDHEWNKYLASFFINQLKRNTVHASYGDQLSSTDLPYKKIMLPVTSDNKPDYEYIESFIKNKEKKQIQIQKKFISNKLESLGKEVKIKNIKDCVWKEFYISGQDGIFNLFSSNSGIDKNKIISGDNLIIPYVTRSDNNNGITLFISSNQNSCYSRDSGNVITVGLDTQTAFYQPYAFYTGQNIQIISSNNLNEYNALFIIELLKKQLKKFNWGGNGATLGRLSRTKLLLPVNCEGLPDYTYMEQYIKNIMINKYKRLMEFLS